MSRPNLLIRRSVVRRYIKARGRRTSNAFLVVLNDHVAGIIERACKAHNGGKITLDAAVAAYVGCRP